MKVDLQHQRPAERLRQPALVERRKRGAHCIKLLEQPIYLSGELPIDMERDPFRAIGVLRSSLVTESVVARTAPRTTGSIPSPRASHAASTPQKTSPAPVVSTASTASAAIARVHPPGASSAPRDPSVTIT